MGTMEVESMRSMEIGKQIYSFLGRHTFHQGDDEEAEGKGGV